MSEYKHPKQIVYIRHGQVPGNAVSSNGEMADHDLPVQEHPLTELGKEQTRITGEYVRETYGDFDEYFVSPYARTIETASILFPNVTPIDDSRICEFWRGVQYALTSEEIEKYYPNEQALLKKHTIYYHRSPGGENFVDFELRIRSFFEMLDREYAGKRVAIVGHQHWLLAAKRVLTNIPVAEVVRLYAIRPFGNASVTVYESEPGGKLELKQEAYKPWEGKIKD